MATLAERYFKYDEQLRNYNNQNLHYEQFNKLQINIHKHVPDFQEAISKLTPDAQSTYRLIDSNVCAWSHSHNMWSPILMKDFKNHLSNTEKNMYYSIIRTHLRKLDKSGSLLRLPLPQHFSYYEKSFFKDNFEDGIKFLYNLTDGDIGTLYDFAKMCSDILNINSAPLKPIVIMADKKAHQTILNFLNRLTDDFNPGYPNNRITNIEFNAFSKNKCIETLHLLNLNGCLINVVINGKIPETESSVNKLSKIMTGKKISINHPEFPGKIYVINRIRFIYITDNHKNYLKMKNLYGAIGIQIPLKEELPVSFPEHKMNWFRSGFSAIGMNLTQGKSKQTLKASKIKDDDIFKAFVKDCCHLSKNAICEKAVLYDAYCSYYEKYYGSTPLTKIMFGKKFAIFGNFETVRPHSSRKHYPYCFKGIEIDNDKINELPDTNECNTIDSSYDDFKNAIEKMKDEIIRIKKDREELSNCCL